MSFAYLLYIKDVNFQMLSSFVLIVHHSSVEVCINSEGFVSHLELLVSPMSVK